MNSLYTSLARVCHIFYKLYFPHERMAASISEVLRKNDCHKIVFFGGCIYVAEILQKEGFEITYVEYTPEMMEEARQLLHDMHFVQSDMRTLELGEQYDSIVLIGRIFTYLPTDEDVTKTLNAFAKNLKSGGILIMDNYEIGKIDQDEYFNGTIALDDGHETVRRTSQMKQIQDHPSLYSWSCVYELERNGRMESFSDNDGHVLRAFSKAEIEKLLQKSPLSFIEHQSNFEEKSFVTIARRS